MKAVKYIMQAIHASVSASPATSQRARPQQQAAITDLPFPVMVQVLAFVPQAHRLSSCAVVCKSWAAASAAATIDPAVSQASYNADARQALQALSTWLEQHPSDVVSIRVPDTPFSQGWSVEVLHPLTLHGAQLSRLEVLQLQGCKVQLNVSSYPDSNLSSSSSSSLNRPAQDATAPVLLPALRELHFNLCEVPVDSLAAMQLPKLTALSLGHWPTELLDHNLEGQAKERQQQRQHHAMLKTLLLRLPQLQFLGLTGIGIAASVNLHLSGLQQLQSCSLAACCINKDSLHGLCSKLTSLQLRDCRDASCFAAVVHVPTAGWPLLQQLCITNMPLPPAVLTQLTALEVLKLTRCGLKPSQRVTSGPYHNPVRAAEAAGATELLSAIAQLTQLRELSLDQINLHAIEQEQIRHTYYPITVSDLISSSGPCNTHLEPFSALTASTKLERLELVFRDINQAPASKPQPLPLGSLQFMFPLNRKLQGLTELMLDAFGPECDAWEGVGNYDEDDLERDFSERWDWDLSNELDTTESSACVKDDDVESIAACCPNLKRLTLNGVVESVEYSDSVARSFRALQRRLQLTHLCLGGPWLTNNTAAVIAGMTSLRSLQLHNAPQLASNGLQALTALRQLRELQLDSVGCGRECNCCFETKAEAPQPDVWRQLAGELENIRQSQRYTSHGGYDYDPEVDMDDWSEWSDWSEGSDTGSDS